MGTVSVQERTIRVLILWRDSSLNRSVMLVVRTTTSTGTGQGG